MCHITKLNCGACHRKDKHTFFPCQDFIDEKIIRLKDKEAIRPGTRFHCPALKWPLASDYPEFTYTLCPECSNEGRAYYQADIKATKMRKLREQENARKMRFMRGEEEPVGPKDELCCGQVADIQEANLREHKDKHLDDHIPLTFKDMKIHLKRMAVNAWSEMGDDISPVKKELLADVSRRYVTVWMPCCSLCKEPTIDEQNHGGIADVEFEPNVAAWLCLKTEAVFQTSVVTGFLHKVCEACVKEEEMLRAQVWDYLKGCHGFAAWAVYQWLLCRGIGQIPMMEHAVMNVGFPSTEPPSLKQCMEVMSASWRRKTGIPWEDTIDFEPPTTCPLVSTIHSRPLLRIDQWNEFVNPRTSGQLEIRRLPPAIIPEFSPDDVSAESVDDPDEPHKPMLHPTGDNAEPKMHILGLDEDAAIAGSHVDMSDGHAASTSNENAVHMKGTKLLLPLEIEIYQRKRRKGENKRSVAVARKGQIDAATLVTIRNAYIDEYGHATRKFDQVSINAAQTEMRVDITAAKPPKDKGKAVEAAHKAAQSELGVERTAIESPEEKKKGKEVEAANTVVDGVRTPELDGSPKDKGKSVETNGLHTPPESTIQSNMAKSSSSGNERRVRFANTPKVVYIAPAQTLDLNGMDVEGDDLFGDAELAEDVPGPSNAGHTKDANPPGGAKDEELAEGEVGVYLCEYGCEHLFDTGGTQPGQLFQLPIGISYAHEHVETQARVAEAQSDSEGNVPDNTLHIDQSGELRPRTPQEVTFAI